jgi:aspartokinase-like uncharacterized kinase
VISTPISLIKVGGSLLDWPELPARLTGFVEDRRRIDPEVRPVLLCGGGAFVDAVRRLDRVHHLGDAVAHRLAIQAMDLAAGILLFSLPGAEIVDSIGVLDEEPSPGEMPVILTGTILYELEDLKGNPLPPSWDVTSDTIAAYIAGELKARSLVLLKSASLPPNATRDQAAKLELVDPFFPLISSAVRRVEYLNLRDPSATAEILP